MYQTSSGKLLYPIDYSGNCFTGNRIFLRQYVLSVMPPSLIEAARIDGASELYTFHRIAIPIMSPGIATMSIMGFIGGWNAYLLPMIILNKNEKFTLPVMMATLRASTDITANQGAIYLAVAISVIPILLVFAFFSKYIISSISARCCKRIMTVHKIVSLPYSSLNR